MQISKSRPPECILHHLVHMQVPQHSWCQGVQSWRHQREGGEGGGGGGGQSAWLTWLQGFPAMQEETDKCRRQNPEQLLDWC